MSIQLAVKMCRLSRGSGAARYPALTSRSGRNSVFSARFDAAARESLQFLLLFCDEVLSQSLKWPFLGVAPNAGWLCLTAAPPSSPKGSIDPFLSSFVFC